MAREGLPADAALALAGGLLHSGWGEEDAAHFIEAVCAGAGDEEVAKRKDGVAATAAKQD